MSVLKSKRKESTIEFVFNAYKIYILTIEFISRLSARYSRLMASDITHLAFEVLRNCESASSIILTNEDTFKKRQDYLVDAKAALSSLDVALSICYEILSQNPSGAMTSKTGKELNNYEANKKLDNMSQTLGELIDLELELIPKTIKNDKERLKKML